VNVDLQLCRQAVLNLVLNAAQASGRGGEVVIRASLETAQQPPSVRVDVLRPAASASAPDPPRRQRLARPGLPW